MKAISDVKMEKIIQKFLSKFAAAERLTSESDLNNCTKAGWYAWSEPSPANAPFTWGMMEVVPYSTGLGCHQRIHRIVGTVANCVLQRTLYDYATWTEYEWVNPPMIVGKEYRTTERWKGKPVYTKIVNIEALPAKASSAPKHSAEATAIIRASGTTGTGLLVPYSYNGVHIDLAVSLAEIRITTNYDFATSADIQIWYTKD